MIRFHLNYSMTPEIYNAMKIAKERYHAVIEIILTYTTYGRILGSLYLTCEEEHANAIRALFEECRGCVRLWEET